MNPRVQAVNLILSIGFFLTLWIPYSGLTVGIRIVSIIVSALLLLYLLSPKSKNLRFDSRPAKFISVLSPVIWLVIHILLLSAGK